MKSIEGEDILLKVQGLLQNIIEDPGDILEAMKVVDEVWNEMAPPVEQLCFKSRMEGPRTATSAARITNGSSFGPHTPSFRENTERRGMEA